MCECGKCRKLFYLQQLSNGVKVNFCRYGLFYKSRATDTLTCFLAKNEESIPFIRSIFSSIHIVYICACATHCSTELRYSHRSLSAKSNSIKRQTYLKSSCHANFVKLEFISLGIIHIFDAYIFACECVCLHCALVSTRKSALFYAFKLRLIFDFLFENQRKFYQK